MTRYKLKKIKEIGGQKVRFRHRHPILYYGLLAICAGTFTAGAMVAAYVNRTIETTPQVTEAMLKSDNSSNMYSADGKLIWSDTRIRRDYVKYKDIPQSYIDLLLSTEDKDFYKHSGFSGKGIANAGLSVAMSVVKGGGARGGSTIEQQLIKNVAFSTAASQRTLKRKIQELWLSQQLYQNFSKHQILEWYINKIYMGEGSYGANTIMITYYGHPLSYYKDRTPQNISKLATIAGLGQAPAAYNLYTDPNLVQRRRDIVLKAALDNGKLTQSEYQAATKVSVKDGLKPRYWRNSDILNETSKYSAYVNSTLAQVKKLGYDMHKTPMQIHTALNTKDQDWLQNEVNKDEYWTNNKAQAAVTVVDPQTGDVIAQVGGRGKSEAYGLNRATQTSRSSGSAIKPFIDYGPAIEYTGLGTGTRLDSSNYRYPGTDIWASNWDRRSHGIVSAKEAFWQSYNTPAIRLLDKRVGSTKAQHMLKALNMDVKNYYGGSDAIGLNVSTSQLASAWSAVANMGIYKPTNYIESITFADNSTRTIQPDQKRAMMPSTAYILQRMAEGVPTNRGTAKEAALPYKGYAVKTGTVAYSPGSKFANAKNMAEDLWIAGTTKSASVALWTGYDQPNQNAVDEMNMGYQKIFKAIMQHFNDNKDTSDWSMPAGVKEFGGDYSPTNVKAVNINKPDIDTSNTDLFDRYGRMKRINVKDSAKSKVPKDYKSGDWQKNAEKNNKDAYEQWTKDSNARSAFRDVLNHQKIFDNSN